MRRVADWTKADGVALLRVWHERLAHVCPQYLKRTVDHGLVKGMMLTERGSEMCTTCQQSKQKRRTRMKRYNRQIEAVNDVVYADLLDPGKHNVSRYRFVLVVVDGCLRHVRIFLLSDKTREATNSHLQEYIQWAERQRNRPVKHIVTDGGGEFVNGDMKQWNCDHGIQHMVIAPSSSQLILAERMNQSLMQMTKTMMISAKFPPSLWPYTMRTAAFVKNRVYCVGAKNATSVELFYGKTPDLHHVRTFGARDYAHIPKDKRPKMAQHCDVGYLAGYSEDEVGCYVCFPQFHCCRLVSDVRVDESSFHHGRASSTTFSVSEADEHDEDSESEQNGNGNDNAETDICSCSGSSGAGSEICSDMDVDLATESLDEDMEAASETHESASESGDSNEVAAPDFYANDGDAEVATSGLRSGGNFTVTPDSCTTE